MLYFAFRPQFRPLRYSLFVYHMRTKSVKYANATLHFTRSLPASVLLWSFEDKYYFSISMDFKIFVFPFLGFVAMCFCFPGGQYRRESHSGREAESCRFGRQWAAIQNRGSCKPTLNATCTQYAEQDAVFTKGTFWPKVSADILAAVHATVVPHPICHEALATLEKWHLARQRTKCFDSSLPL